MIFSKIHCCEINLHYRTVFRRLSCRSLNSALFIHPHETVSGNWWFQKYSYKVCVYYIRYVYDPSNADKRCKLWYLSLVGWYRNFWLFCTLCPTAYIKTISRKFPYRRRTHWMLDSTFDITTSTSDTTESVEKFALKINFDAMASLCISSAIPFLSIIKSSSNFQENSNFCTKLICKIFTDARYFFR